MSKNVSSPNWLSRRFGPAIRAGLLNIRPWQGKRGRTRKQFEA
jgi:hypothetical protein